MSTLIKDVPEQQYVINTFQNGINEFTDELMLDNSALNAAQNAKTEKGVLEVHGGFSKLNSAHLTTPVESLLVYYKNNIGYIFAISNGHLYKLNDDGAGFTDMFSGFTNNKFDSINFNTWEGDILIFGNGIDNTKVYNGTAIRDLKHDGKDSSISTTNKAPKCKFLELHYERVWAAGDKDNPNRIYFSTANSEIFDPDDWTAPITEGEANQHGGFIDLPTFDGGIIIGLKVIFNDIIIFKTKQVIRIFGTYPGNYQIDQLFSSTGTIADKSIAACDKGAFFADYDGIHYYDGSNVSKISDKINKTWATLNRDYVKYAVGAFYDGKYILAIPEGASTKNNLIIEYNTKTNSFMLIRGYTVNSFAEYTDHRLVFTNDDGYIYLYDSSALYDNKNIDMFIETGWSNLGVRNGSKTLSMCYFEGSTSTASGQIKLIFYSDRHPDGKSKIITLLAATKQYKFRIRLSGRLFKFRVENVNGSVIKITPPMVTYDYDTD